MNEASEASEKETREQALQQGARAVSEAMVPTSRAEARKGAAAIRWRRRWRTTR